MNLLTETRASIRESGHTIEDIAFIGSTNGWECSWGEFQALADQDYDESYGAQEVASDLIIVFTDGGMLWRHEYDGSESWQCSMPFTRPAQVRPIRYLFGRYWPTLNGLHDPSQADRQHPH